MNITMKSKHPQLLLAEIVCNYKKGIKKSFFLQAVNFSALEIDLNGILLREKNIYKIDFFQKVLII